MLENEQQIISDVQSGNQSRFADLYDAYIKKVYKFIYFKTSHHESAQDLTADTFIKAMRKISSYDSSKGSFSAWLFQIARNTVIDHYRSDKKHYDIEDVWDLSDETDIERDADFKLKLAQIEKYLKELTAEQREIIILRIWQDMSYKEIAQVLNKSESSCKMAFSRGMSQLHKNIPAELLLTLLIILKTI